MDPKGFTQISESPAQAILIRLCNCLDYEGQADLGPRVQGLGFRVQRLVFRVQGSAIFV